MNAPPAMSLMFPRPRRALWVALIGMTVLGIFTAFLGTWVPGGSEVFGALAFHPTSALSRPWALLTSGLLTSPEHWNHLALSLVGLYFLGAPLEQRWGSWRFARVLVLAVIGGNLTVLAISGVAPPDALGRFHPELVFGPTAAVTAIAIAWSREYADATVNLFFVLPVKGKVLFWATIAFCVLGLIYPAPLFEGVVAPFGGVIVGLVFGGTPSVARTAWLHLRLAVLRRRASAVQLQDVLDPKPKRRSRPGSPPLRVVSGGLEDVLKKRTPPKDKRYLN